MASNPVNWFEIYVQDMARARRFYEAVFDTRLQMMESPDIEMWGFPGESGAPGAAGALVRMEGVQSGGNSTLVYFRCEDCAVEAGRAAENGGKVFKEKSSIGSYGYIAQIADTDGNVIGLHSER